MKFQISKNIKTDASELDILEFLNEQFETVSQEVVSIKDTIKCKSIEASFGSINRKDLTTISLKKTKDGYMITANVNYEPSGEFWLFIILGLFCLWPFWICIVFYVYQKESVKSAIINCLDNTKNNFE